MGSPLRSLRNLRLRLEIVYPLAKLLSYVVPFGDAGHVSAPIGQRSKTIRVHRAAFAGC
jgi:hypothetical protein